MHGFLRSQTQASINNIFLILTDKSGVPALIFLLTLNFASPKHLCKASFPSEGGTEERGERNERGIESVGGALERETAAVVALRP